MAVNFPDPFWSEDYKTETLPNSISLNHHSLAMIHDSALFIGLTSTRSLVVIKT
jgi:hypothetical protein